MKLYDSGTELLILRTMVDNPDRGAVIMSKVDGEYFGYDAAKEVYGRVKVLVEAGKQVPSIDLLRNDPILSDVARTWLSSEVAPLAEDDFEAAFSTLSNYRKGRLLMQAFTSSSEKLSVDNPDMEGVLGILENMISKCRSGMQTSEMFHISDANQNTFLDEVENDLKADEGQFIPSGFKEFDKRTGGFRRGQVLTLAAPSGGGKSAMMGQMAILQYMMGFNVCVISFEMTNEDLRMRLLSNISKLNHADIHVRRLLEEQKALVRKRSKEFVKTGFDNRLTLWGSSEDLNIRDIAARIKPHKYDIVYIDYVGLLKEPAGVSQQKVLGDHVRDCKLAAKNLNCVMAPLVQLDDETLTIKYSKAIKANSDFIWAWEVDAKQQEAGVIKVMQQKARSASPYDFYLSVDFSRMAFEDYNGPPPVIEPPANQPALPKMQNLAG